MNLQSMLLLLIFQQKLVVPLNLFGIEGFYLEQFFQVRLNLLNKALLPLQLDQSLIMLHRFLRLTTFFLLYHKQLLLPSQLCMKRDRLHEVYYLLQFLFQRLFYIHQIQIFLFLPLLHSLLYD